MRGQIKKPYFLSYPLIPSPSPLSPFLHSWNSPKRVARANLRVEEIGEGDVQEIGDLPHEVLLACHELGVGEGHLPQVLHQRLLLLGSVIRVDQSRELVEPLRLAHFLFGESNHRDGFVLGETHHAPNRAEDGVELVGAEVEVAAGGLQQKNRGRELELAIGDSGPGPARRSTVQLGLQLYLEKNVDRLRQRLLELGAELRRKKLHVLDCQAASRRRQRSFGAE